MLCGASIILGNNGFIWISPIISDDHQQPQHRFQTPTNVSSVEKEERVSQWFNPNANCSHFLLVHWNTDTS